MMMSLTSLAADCLGGVSCALLRTSRLVQALLADPAPRRTAAAPREVTVTGDEAAAEATRLKQVIAELQSELALETHKTPDEERLEEEPQGLQDAILQVRQEMDSTIAGLQGEVTSLTQQLQASEVEMRKLKGATHFTMTRINKKVEEEMAYWKDVQKDNADLIAEQEHLLGLMHGLRSQLGAKDREISSIQGDMELLKGDKEMEDLFREQMEKDLAYKTWEIEELKQEVEGAQQRAQWEAEGRALELEVLNNCSHVHVL